MSIPLASICFIKFGYLAGDTILFIKEQLLQANMDKLFLELERAPFTALPH